MLRDQGVTEDDVEADLQELEAMLAQEEIGGADVPSNPIHVEPDEEQVESSFFFLEFQNMFFRKFIFIVA